MSTGGSNIQVVADVILQLDRQQVESLRRKIQALESGNKTSTARANEELRLISAKRQLENISQRVANKEIRQQNRIQRELRQTNRLERERAQLKQRAVSSIALTAGGAAIGLLGPALGFQVLGIGFASMVSPAAAAIVAFSTAIGASARGMIALSRATLSAAEANNNLSIEYQIATANISASLGVVGGNLSRNLVGPMEFFGTGLTSMARNLEFFSRALGDSGEKTAKLFDTILKNAGPLGRFIAAGVRTAPGEESGGLAGLGLQLRQAKTIEELTKLVENLERLGKVSEENKVAFDALVSSQRSSILFIEGEVKLRRELSSIESRGESARRRSLGPLGRFFESLGKLNQGIRRGIFPVEKVGLAQGGLIAALIQDLAKGQKGAGRKGLGITSLEGLQRDFITAQKPDEPTKADIRAIEAAILRGIALDGDDRRNILMELRRINLGVAP